MMTILESKPIFQPFSKFSMFLKWKILTKVFEEVLKKIQNLFYFFGFRTSEWSFGDGHRWLQEYFVKFG